MKNHILAEFIIAFYRIWHGRFGLKGAGFLIKQLGDFMDVLRSYRLTIDGGHTITIDLTDTSGGAWLNYVIGDKHQEFGLIKCIRGIAGIEDMVIWDIGANCGLLSHILLDTCNPRQIYAIEPNPAVFKIAQDALKWRDNAETLNAGMSSAPGTLHLEVTKGCSFTAKIRSDDSIPNSDEVTSYEIHVHTGDQLVEEMGYMPPGVVKIDTEGHEQHVMAGMKNVIQNYRPYLIIESIEFSEDEIVDMTPNGYEVYAINNDSGALMKEIKNPNSHNIVMCPSDSFKGIQLTQYGLTPII